MTLNSTSDLARWNAPVDPRREATYMTRNSTSDLTRWNDPTAYLQIGSGPQLAGLLGDIWGGIKSAGGALWGVVSAPATLVTAAITAIGGAIGIPPGATAAMIGIVRTAVAARGGGGGAVEFEMNGVRYTLSAGQVETIMGVPVPGTIAGIPTTYVVVVAVGLGLYLVLRK